VPLSPLDASQDEASDRESDFRKSLTELDQLIDRGVGLSGHERNCAFINVPGEGGTRRFATASAALGLDFKDDARSPALVDWDRDGDLDLWIANRTAPMLRFVRNNGQKSRHWLALRLRGTTSNRDGIGSRVDVRLANQQLLTQTLKAGEGYLAQSSKWLHFGLDVAEGIEEVRVHWSGGMAESFTACEIDGRYHLIQGQGKAQRTDRSSVTLANAPTKQMAEAAPTVQSLTPSRWPLPRLPYTTFDGKPGFVAEGANNQLTLVNLWATWCIPCQAELRGFTQNAKQYQQAGIKILALSVDGLSIGEDSTTTPAQGSPQAFYQKLKAPFDAGMASPELIRRLELTYARLFGPRWPLPVPTSVLLDKNGAILAFYKGAVPTTTILADAAQKDLQTDTRHDASLPFPGTWMFRPKPLSPLHLALDLMEHEYLDDAIELAQRSHSSYSTHEEYPKLLIWMGDKLIKQERAPEALQHYQAALALDDNNTTVLNNIAWQMAAHPDSTVRNGKQAVIWAEKAAVLTKNNDPAILDTLAAAYAESGDFSKAIATATKAARLAKKQGNRSLWEGVQQGLVKYRSGLPYASP
jgi:thiol-disulfide isomerase/thioredoxin